MSTVSFVLIVMIAFVAMEPITAATHRWVMHGVAEYFHRSHHRPGLRPRWEKNDWFPVFFGSMVLIGLWLGFNHDSLATLVPVGVGITLYGLTYALVHDGYIHRRLGPVGRRRLPVLDHLAASHRIHHLYNAAPYGMLVPVVPAELRERARATDRDPFADVRSDAATATV